MNPLLLSCAICPLVTPAAAPIPKDVLEREEEAKRLRANMAKLAAQYDTMDSDAVAPIMRQMVESGRIELAAEILLLMKERRAARVIEALEPSLGARLLERMLRLRAQKPPSRPVAPAPRAAP